MTFFHGIILRHILYEDPSIKIIQTSGLDWKILGGRNKASLLLL